MRNWFYLFCSVFVLVYEVNAQVLLPSIGVFPVPDDTTSICNIPVYTGSPAASGLQPGDTAADFTLYDTMGNAFNLSAALALGKPVLLVSGSYTCPVFRSKIASINDVVNTFGSQVTVAVIYCVEAHPTTISPYFGVVNVTLNNYNDGILYPQPLTYGDRKHMVTDMLANNTLLAPVFLDGACNEWWSYYGPAANNAYLIDTNGIVFTKHAWYDEYPEDIKCDIDSLIGTTGNCDTTNYNGAFSINLLSNDSVYGAPGSTLTVSLELVNANTNASVAVDLTRMFNIIPGAWGSSMCATVCYGTSVNNATIVIPPMSTQIFHVYFYTDSNPASGYVVVKFNNAYFGNNSYTHAFYASTDLSSAPTLESESFVKCYPNPSDGQITVEKSAGIGKTGFQVLDMYGKNISNFVLAEGKTSRRLNLAPGVYLLKASYKGSQRVQKLIVK